MKVLAFLVPIHRCNMRAIRNNHRNSTGPTCKTLDATLRLTVSGTPTLIRAYHQLPFVALASTAYRQRQHHLNLTISTSLAKKMDTSSLPKIKQSLIKTYKNTYSRDTPCGHPH